MMLVRFIDPCAEKTEEQEGGYLAIYKHVSQ